MTRIPLFSEGAVFSWPFEASEAFHLLSTFVTRDSITRDNDYDLITFPELESRLRTRLRTVDDSDLEESLDDLTPNVLNFESLFETAEFIKWKEGNLSHVLLNILQDWNDNPATGSNYPNQLQSCFNPQRVPPLIESQTWDKEKRIDRFILFVKKSGSLELVILSALVRVLEEVVRSQQNPSTKLKVVLQLLFYPQIGKHVFLISKHYKQALQVRNWKEELNYCYFYRIIEKFFEEEEDDQYYDEKDIEEYPQNPQIVLQENIQYDEQGIEQYPQTVLQENIQKEIKGYPVSDLSFPISDLSEGEKFDNPNNFRDLLESVQDFLYFTDLRNDQINRIVEECEASEKFLEPLCERLRKKCIAGTEVLIDSQPEEPTN